VAIPVALSDIAASQRGLVTRAQALASGLTPSALLRRVRSGDLVAVHPNVYRVPGAPVAWEQRAVAAALAAGPRAAVSHRAAARIWRLLDLDAPIEIVVPRARGPRLAGVVVHRSTDLTAAHVTVRDGITVTKPLRTMVDLGAVVPWWLVRESLDAGVANKLFSVAAVDAERERLARCGRDGCGVLLLALERSTLTTQSRTKLEARFARLSRRFGLPHAEFQHRVRDHGRFLGQVDFAYPDLRIAIEVDGWETHGSPTAMTADYVRQNKLIAAGWVVLRFTWHQVTHEQAAVAAVVRAALDTAHAGIRR
jgi:very-short-patch-repair endonuclease